MNLRRLRRISRRSPLSQTRLCRARKLDRPQTPLPPYIDARIEAWLVAPTPTLPPPSLLSPLSSPLPRITSPILPSSPIHIDFILEDHMLIYKRAQFSTMSHRFEIRESFTTAARQLRSTLA
uniref:Uncharacterized protein n=1 Tax=Tanacetum cinerariifolium TaxID=118510 RepID=A0A699UWR8_TANCI|nr:hypothetical protein [Tanacetum cinerariifolium]